MFAEAWLRPDQNGPILNYSVFFGGYALAWKIALPAINLNPDTWAGHAGDFLVDATIAVAVALPLSPLLALFLLLLWGVSELVVRLCCLCLRWGWKHQIGHTVGAHSLAGVGVAWTVLITAEIIALGIVGAVERPGSALLEATFQLYLYSMLIEPCAAFMVLVVLMLRGARQLRYVAVS